MKVASRGQVVLGLMICLSTGSGGTSTTAATQQSQQARVLLALRGRVVSASAEDGVAGATVVINGVKDRREIKTDLTGNFAFDRLPPGEYRVSATHPDYERGSYGQMWRAAPMRPLRLLTGDGQPIIIRLPSTASITGTVKTTDGTPVTGATVQAISHAPGRLSSVFTGVTGTNGTYAIKGIAPGNYIVGSIQSYQTMCGVRAPSDCALRAREGSLRPVEQPSGEIQTYRSAFYPTALDASGAEVVRLRSGETRSSVDLTISVAKGSTLNGIVSSLRGPMPNVLVRASTIGNTTLDPIVSLGDFIANTDNDGRFRLLNMPAGAYSLNAEERPRSTTRPTVTQGPFGEVTGGSVSSVTPSNANPIFEGRTEVTIGSSDISDYQLTLFPAPFLRGIVLFDSTAAKPSAAELGAASITLRPQDRGTPLTRVSLDASGSFSFPSQSQNTYILVVDGLPGWSVRSIELPGRQTTGQILLEQPITTAVVHLTHVDARIVGTVVDSKGRPEPNATVFLFREVVGSPSEPLVSAFSSASGGFAFGALARGDYSLVAVVDGWLDLDWKEPDAAARLLKFGTRIRLGDNQPASKTLRGLRLE